VAGLLKEAWILPHSPPATGIYNYHHAILQLQQRCRSPLLTKALDKVHEIKQPYYLHCVQMLLPPWIKGIYNHIYPFMLLRNISLLDVYRLAALGVVVALTYSIWRSHRNHRLEPPAAPSRIPFIGHLVGLVQHGAEYFNYLASVNPVMRRPARF
jgi:hypothetical protein